MRLLLFMIVTPPDLEISYYSIRALLLKLSDTVNLQVFFNGVESDKQNEIHSSFNSPYLAFEENTPEIFLRKKEIEDQIGQDYLTNSGRMAHRQGLWANGSEIWSRELIKFMHYDLIGIIDADFEVLESDFIDDAINKFLDNPRLGFFSANFSPDQVVFDTYSGEETVIKSRYSTWFCIYRAAALARCCDFSYYEERDENEIRKWDHSAKLQEILSRNYGFVGDSISNTEQWKFIHYGAFAKNRTLFGWKLFFYRAIRIGRHNGYRHIVKTRFFSKLITRICNRLYRLCELEEYRKERSRFLYQGSMPEVMIRASGLEITEVYDGYIVYNSFRDNVCHLNNTAAIIFEFCDGKLNKNEVVACVTKIFDLSDSGHAEIRSCVDALIKEGLIQST